MSKALDDARNDEKIGVVILTGEGRDAFCSGGDQKIRGDAGYRDHKLAVVAATSLLKSVGARTSPSERIRVRGDCAFALMSAGLLDEARELFKQTQTEALLDRVYSRASAAAFHLSVIEIALDDFRTARTQAEVQLEIARKKPDPFLEALALRNFCRISLLEGDVSSARSSFQASCERSPVAAHPKWHAFEIALRLGIATAESNVADVDRLLPLGDRQLASLGSSLGQDFLASRVAVGLRKTGACTAAVNLIDDYIRNHRREGYATPFYLQRSIT